MLTKTKPPETETVSTIPVSLPAERSVLGALVESPEIYAEALAEGLRVDDFFLSGHRRIFETMVSLSKAGIPVDYVTLMERLGDSDTVAALLCDLAGGVVLVSSHILHHVRILKKKSRLRSLLNLSEWLQQAASHPSADPVEIQREVRSRLEAMKGVVL